jgi:hypothetical protein
MKFKIGYEKTRDQWNDNIIDTKKGLNFRNTNQHSDGTNHPWKQNDSVSDSDTTPQFQSENQ